MTPAQAVEGSEREALPSQQRLQSPLNRASHQVDECSLWVPRKINLDQGSQGRKLHVMANADRGQRKEVLPRDEQNTEGAPEPSQVEHPGPPSLPRSRKQIRLRSKERKSAMCT